ncbi:MAG: cell division protein FtsQ/DivIB, partial [Elusimicrobia bacterium]|nr:cell division protein FtsQ/DivIB [Elusimicrobiota bacterium]
DKITVKVEERKPLAILKEKTGDFVLTADGFIVKKYPQVAKKFKIPVWGNFGETKDRLKDIQEFLVKLVQKEADFYRRLKKFSFDGKNLNFYFEDFEVIFGRPATDTFKEKISAIEGILADLEKKGKKVSYIDLRPFTKKMQSAIIKTKEINSKNLGDKNR